MHESSDVLLFTFRIVRFLEKPKSHETTSKCASVVSSLIRAILCIVLCCAGVLLFQEGYSNDDIAVQQQ